VEWGPGLDRCDSGQGQVVGTCKRVSEPSDSVKFGKYLVQLLKKDSDPWSK
jgi:hypothetical protein